MNGKALHDNIILICEGAMEVDKKENGNLIYSMKQKIKACSAEKLKNLNSFVSCSIFMAQHLCTKKF
jgi:hypothetical protein